MASTSVFLVCAALLLDRSSGYITPPSQIPRTARAPFSIRLHDEAEAPPTCPFSKPYPRYKLDLTRFSAPKQPTFLESFFPRKDEKPLTASQIKRRAKREFKEAQWLPDQTGVQAISTLWRAAASLSDNNKVAVVALPDCEFSILVNFKEILDWIQDEPMIAGHVRLETTVMHDNQVIKMELISSSGPAQRGDTPVIDDAVIERRTQAWVKRLLVERQICPFTKSVVKSGQGMPNQVPVGFIAYHHSTAENNIYQLMTDTWTAIGKMLVAGPSGKEGISSILLAAPGYDQFADTWSGPIFCILEATVVAAKASAEVGVVCFHPYYQTSDGSTWPGFGHMHSVPRLEGWYKEQTTGDDEDDEGQPQEIDMSSQDIAAGGAWQRRTPHATINVLRADQLELAEGRRNSPEMYTRNINLLMEIGNEQLECELQRERNMQ